MVVAVEVDRQIILAHPVRNDAFLSAAGTVIIAPALTNAVPLAALVADASLPNDPAVTPGLEPREREKQVREGAERHDQNAERT